MNVVYDEAVGRAMEKFRSNTYMTERELREAKRELIWEVYQAAREEGFGRSQAYYEVVALTKSVYSTVVAVVKEREGSQKEGGRARGGKAQGVVAYMPDGTVRRFAKKGEAREVLRISNETLDWLLETGDPYMPEKRGMRDWEVRDPLIGMTLDLV